MRPFLLPCLLALISTAPIAQAEQRLAFSAQSPLWLRAVGKLEVSGSQVENGYRKHKREDCSGTLIARNPDSNQADIVVTAWHCLEYYNDLSRPIVFTLLPNSDTPLVREARRIASGGNMDADWALLKLTRSVSAEQVRGLTVHPQQADTGLQIVMAGYSGDQGLGDNGEVMTYHSGCRITAQSRRASESNCEAYKGASGGAVIQVTEGGAPQLAGVISRGDSETVSIFVPIAGFRTSLNQALR
ncbi:trypsin-like serine peptidase [Halioglobus maricola]|uniref:trypsin-like serine peptidase n=1 Tax=Halioglobus maricola TaxID=2601894 RepID=UPI001479716A|nr:trypsin-like peptidase domain-containing protein [Halioglobus maricola]